MARSRRKVQVLRRARHRARFKLGWPVCRPLPYRQPVFGRDVMALFLDLVGGCRG